MAPRGRDAWKLVHRTQRRPLKELQGFTGNAKELYEDYLPENVISETRGWAIIVDGQGRCRHGYKGTENPGGHSIHIVSSSVPSDYLAFLQTEQIPYLIGGHEHADLTEALSKLHSKLGLRAIKVIGGGTLNGVMVSNQLVDEIHLIVTPALFGGERTPTLVDCEALTFGPTMPVLELLSSEADPNGLVWLHYKVHYEQVAKAQG
jgi:2,5-diamino-6-(ribosylamino)-4(3H)-pyrimidinone 5'-phosphate reductase